MDSSYVEKVNKQICLQSKELSVEIADTIANININIFCGATSMLKCETCIQFYS